MSNAYVIFCCTHDWCPMDFACTHVPAQLTLPK